MTLPEDVRVAELKLLVGEIFNAGEYRGRTIPSGSNESAIPRLDELFVKAKTMFAAAKAEGLEYARSHGLERFQQGKAEGKREATSEHNADYENGQHVGYQEGVKALRDAMLPADYITVAKFEDIADQLLQ